MPGELDLISVTTAHSNNDGGSDHDGAGSGATTKATASLSSTREMPMEKQLPPAEEQPRSVRQLGHDAQFASRDPHCAPPPASQSAENNFATVPPSDEGTNDEEAYKPNTMNLLIVITYFACTADQSMQQRALLCIWLLVGVLVAFASQAVLLALSITNNWVSCATNDGCNLGLACANLFYGDGARKRPFCLDCFFLTDHEGAGTEHPWQHTLAGELSVVNATGEVAGSIGLRIFCHTDSTTLAAHTLFKLLLRDFASFCCLCGRLLRRNARGSGECALLLRHFRGGRRRRLASVVTNLLLVSVCDSGRQHDDNS